MTRSSIFIAAVAFATLTVLEPTPAQTPTSSGVIALTGARIIDGTGRAPLQQGTIIVNKGVIEAVGAPAAVKIPPGATRVDLSGKTIIPGLINAHAHLNVQQGARLPVRDDLIRRLKTYAMYGVTTAVSLGSRPADELEGIKLRDEQTRVALDRARVYTGGVNAIGTTPEEARKSVDRLADLKVDVIKYHINGNPNDMTPDIYGALVDEAKKKGLRTFVHIVYLKDAKGAVEKGTDVLAHSIRDQDVDPAFAAELKRRNIGYIPTLTRDLSVFVYETRPAFFDEPFFRKGIALYGEEVDPLSSPASQEKIRNDKQAQSIKQMLQQANRNLKILSDAGVPIAMGTDSGAEGNPGRWQGYFEHVEMEMMAKAGMTPMQVIVAATGGAARITKVDPKIGTIEPGKWADLLVLNANPLDDIRNTRQIHSVWVGGQRITDAQRGDRVDWNLKAPWGATRQDATHNPKTPFKIFDNAYYVGLQTVCAYLITTSSGLVLIDSTFADTGDAVLNSVRTLGFNPADIKYVFITHSHTDHAGGAARIKQVTRAQVGMSAEDWAVIEKTGPVLARDLVLKDGQAIRLGDVTFKFYVTPGHTPGATSIEYQVRDGGRTYRALSPGGLGMQFGPAETPTFLNSVERLKQLGPWDAMLSNHPWLMPRSLGDIEKDLASRGRGAHPAILGPAKINEWFDAVIKVTKEKLAAGQ